MASSNPAPVSESDVWTVARILEWTTRFLKDHGSDTPRLDSEILLAHVRQCQRIQLYTSYDSPLTAEERARMRDLVKRRANAEPVAYLVGHREFFGLDLKVTQDVLIPRPDTETLVVQLLERAENLRPPKFDVPTAGAPPVDQSQAIEVQNPQQPAEENPVSPPALKPEISKPAKDEIELSILELCTGSGCIAIAAAVNLPKAQLVATDVSEAALKIARENAERHNVSNRISFHQGDLFAALPSECRFDLIVSNPPYVPEHEIAGLDPDVKNHEPLQALEAGPEGMKYLDPLVDQAGNYLHSEGWLLLETGVEQARLTQLRLESHPDFQEVRVIKDLGGRPRVVMAQRRPFNAVVNG